MEGKFKNIAIKVVLIILCIPLFLLGDFLLNDFSTRYQVFLGLTFHVILGCTLMAGSVVYILFTIKIFFFQKEKKGNVQNHLFLKTIRKSLKQNKYFLKNEQL